MLLARVGGVRAPADPVLDPPLPQTRPLQEDDLQLITSLNGRTTTHLYFIKN